MSSGANLFRRLTWTWEGWEKEYWVRVLLIKMLLELFVFPATHCWRFEQIFQNIFTVISFVLWPVIIDSTSLILVVLWVLYF